MLTDLKRTGIDAVALKPTEHDLEAVLETDVESVVIDYEGREPFPDPETLATIAERRELFVTTPVRADGVDPLGDDSLLDLLPEDATRVLVAGNRAYLTETEANRAIAPRLRAARESDPDAWVGTEGIERLALTVGGTQFEILSRGTERQLRALRAAGFKEPISLYAPTVLADDPDETLDAIGAYVARRDPVRAALPSDAATDSTAEGPERELLLQASRDYALVGNVETIEARIRSLEAAGVDRIVAYPADAP